MFVDLRVCLLFFVMVWCSLCVFGLLLCLSIVVCLVVRLFVCDLCLAFLNVDVWLLLCMLLFVFVCVVVRGCC